MTSIDELFKKSGVPSKRKFEPIRDPNEIYKSVKYSKNGSSSRHARVEDEDDREAGPSQVPDGENGEEDGDYGPAPPPDDGDEDGDDEEGRFFGGGITKTEANILDYVEGQDDGTGSQRRRGGRGAGDEAAAAAEETFDAAWLRKTALNLEKRINRNAELRARYESEPTKFIGSEADLDADVKALSILGEHPDLYPEFARLGSVGSLVGLLAHDNTDIAISAIEIIGELTDEDVDATDEQWAALVDALLEADLVGLLVSNLARLDEDAEDDADRTGVYYALGIVENLCSGGGGGGGGSATKAADALGGHEGLVRWLLRRVQKKEADPATGAPTVTQNKQYAAEILAILAQASPANCGRMADLDAVDVLLQLVAAYRRRDPERGDEEEYMENLFEALTYLVDDPADLGRDGPSKGKAKFLEAEGVELCLLLLKDGKKSRGPALRLLDHATGGHSAGDVCRRIVDAGGLKTTFTLFMRGDDDGGKKHKHKKQDKKSKDSTRLHAGSTAEHLLAIFASMLRLLPADSAERIRLLAKFVEKDYEKVDQLMALRTEYAARVDLVDQQMEEEGRGLRFASTLDDGDEEKLAWAAERLSRRLDAGLFTLQTIDIILAWLVAEDDGARKKIAAVLADRDDTVAVLRTSLQERRDELDVDMVEGKDMHEMLTALIDFLQ